jgi:hypothetical protein
LNRRGLQNLQKNVTLENVKDGYFWKVGRSQAGIFSTGKEE